LTFSWEDLWKFLIGLGTLVGVAAVAAYQWRKGRGNAAMTAASEWEAVASARQAEDDALERKVKVLENFLVDEKASREKAERDHNEATQRILRLLARTEKLERTVNDLQRQLGQPVTDFSDPLHRSETPDRVKH
jgi:uncharacterized protein YlxW (UPF0749 family)